MANAADRKQVSEAERKAEDMEMVVLNDFRLIMQTLEGRRWIWWLLSESGVFRSSFTGNSATFFNEGMRNLGLKILNQINVACPERYLQMTTEAQHREKGNG